MKQLLILIFSLVIVGCNTEPKFIVTTPNNGKTYEEVPVDKTITRNNWDCKDYCSEQNAGYEWAKQNGITEPENCSGKSVSFIEGCEAYANEN